MVGVIKKQIITKFEIVDYLNSNKQSPLYLVTNDRQIKFKLLYSNYNSIKITNYTTDSEQILDLTSTLSCTFLDNCQIYTLDGVNKLLNILDKK